LAEQLPRLLHRRSSPVLNPERLQQAAVTFGYGSSSCPFLISCGHCRAVARRSIKPRQRKNSVKQFSMHDACDSTLCRSQVTAMGQRYLDRGRSSTCPRRRRLVFRRWPSAGHRKEIPAVAPGPPFRRRPPFGRRRRQHNGRHRCQLLQPRCCHGYRFGVGPTTSPLRPGYNWTRNFRGNCSIFGARPVQRRPHARGMQVPN